MLCGSSGDLPSRSRPSKWMTCRSSRSPSHESGEEMIGQTSAINCPHVGSEPCLIPIARVRNWVDVGIAELPLTTPSKRQPVAPVDDRRDVHGPNGHPVRDGQVQGVDENRLQKRYPVLDRTEHVINCTVEVGDLEGSQVNSPLGIGQIVYRQGRVNLDRPDTETSVIE